MYGLGYKNALVLLLVLSDIVTKLMSLSSFISLAYADSLYGQSAKVPANKPIFRFCETMYT